MERCFGVNNYQSVPALLVFNSGHGVISFMWKEMEGQYLILVHLEVR